MKTTIHFTLGLAAVFALSATVSAQNEYRLTAWTLAGGGGSCTGGVFALNGAIGQPVVGGAGGGLYSLEGGFWAAVQTPGAPHLSIALAGNGLIVSWPRSATGWLLEEISAITGGELPSTSVALPYQTNATHISVAVTAPVGNKFYRLRANPQVPRPDLIPVPDPDAGIGFCRRIESGPDASKLFIIVMNQGSTVADASTTKVEFLRDGILVRPPDLLPTKSLEPGEPTSLRPLTMPACFGPDCSFRITVDADETTTEVNEMNNVGSGRCLG